MRSMLLAATAAAIAAVMMIPSAPSQAQPPAAPKPAGWTYKVVHMTKLVDDDAHGIDARVAAIEKNMNSLGAQGWELCQEVNGAMIFKRRL
jgi:hypothetical protein